MERDQLIEVCAGNEDALRLCLAWRAFCHQLDDIEDGDNPDNLADDKVIGTQSAWFLETQLNPFWLQHKERLLPLVEISFNAWLDANGWERGTPEQQVAADVLKGWYHELIFYCARLAGGWEHYRAVTTKFREYDFDSLNKIALVDRDTLPET